MKRSYGTLIVLATLLLATRVAAQDPPAAPDQKPTASGPATISGNVTVDGKRAAGVTVVLMSGDVKIPGAMRIDVKGRSTTDAQGHYLFDKVSAGSYTVIPFSPRLATPPSMAPSGKYFSIAAGDSIDEINFDLTRGGVITGQVTRADGRPEIGAQVMLQSIDHEDAYRTDPANNFVESLQFCDDRGIYRIYGLPPGRYTVSARRVSASAQFGSVYYPGVTDGSQAGIVTVSCVQETDKIDIVLPLPGKTYDALGTVG